MIYVDLKKKIRDLIKSKSTLLWLEGAKYEQVNNVQIKAGKVVLSLENETIKIVLFDKYAFTSVGIQFWNQGRPGVLYKWDLPANSIKNNLDNTTLLGMSIPEDDPTPPDMAA